MFSENFCPVWDSLLSANMDLKNADEKTHTVLQKKQKGKKTDTVWIHL